MSNGTTVSTLTPSEKKLLWVAVVGAVLSFLASIVLFFNLGQAPWVNKEGRELTKWIADTKFYAPPDGKKEMGFSLWTQRMTKDVEALWDKANDNGWKLPVEDRHFEPPPPPGW